MPLHKRPKKIIIPQGVLNPNRLNVLDVPTNLGDNDLIVKTVHGVGASPGGKLSLESYPGGTYNQLSAPTTTPQSSSSSATAKTRRDSTSNTPPSEKEEDEEVICPEFKPSRNPKTICTTSTNTADQSSSCACPPQRTTTICPSLHNVTCIPPTPQPHVCQPPSVCPLFQQTSASQCPAFQQPSTNTCPANHQTPSGVCPAYQQTPSSVCPSYQQAPSITCPAYQQPSPICPPPQPSPICPAATSYAPCSSYFQSTPRSTFSPSSTLTRPYCPGPSTSRPLNRHSPICPICSPTGILKSLPYQSAQKMGPCPSYPVHIICQPAEPSRCIQSESSIKPQIGPSNDILSRIVEDKIDDVLRPLIVSLLNTPKQSPVFCVKPSSNMIMSPESSFTTCSSTHRSKKHGKNKSHGSMNKARVFDCISDFFSGSTSDKIFLDTECKKSSKGCPKRAKCVDTESGNSVRFKMCSDSSESLMATHGSCSSIDSSILD